VLGQLFGQQAHTECRKETVMKQIFALWHDYSEWTFFANSLEEAKEYGMKICNERGWKYHGVTARNPYRPCCPHPAVTQPESNCPKSSFDPYDTIEQQDFIQKGK
jgi:hypothetical protein